MAVYLEDRMANEFEFGDIVLYHNPENDRGGIKARVSTGVSESGRCQINPIGGGKPLVVKTKHLEMVEKYQPKEGSAKYKNLIASLKHIADYLDSRGQLKSADVVDTAMRVIAEGYSPSKGPRGFSSPSTTADTKCWKCGEMIPADSKFCPKCKAVSKKYIEHTRST